MSNVPTNLIPQRITNLPEAPVADPAGYFPIVISGTTYKVQFSQIQGNVEVPASRIINAGTGLTGGGSLSQDITIAVANGGIGDSQLDTTGVGAGTYGDGANVPVVTVNTKGRVTSLSTTPLVISGYVPNSRQVVAGTGLSGGGNLAADRTLAIDFSSATPQPLGSATAGTGVNAAREDHVHPALDLADGTETTGILPMGRGGTGASLSPAAGALAYSTGSQIALTTIGTVGQILRSNGTTAPFWADDGGGSVRTVNMSTTLSGLSFTGSPITVSGVITLVGTLNISSGGTGASTQSGARTNLGLGTMAVQDANSVSISNGSINVTSLSATSGNVSTLTSTSGTITTLVSTSATLTTIAGTSANITTITENASPVVVQTDIGSAPNEIPLNQYLGTMAYQDAAAITVDEIVALNASLTLATIASASITNLTAGSLVLANLSIGSANITTLTAGSATLTNLTSTSATVTTLASTSATVTNLNSTSANITTLTGTTFGTTATTQLRGASGAITTLTGSSADITTITGTTIGTTASSTIRGISGNITNLAVTSLTISSLSLSNATVTSATITTLTATSANITTLTGTTLGTFTSGTVTNLNVTSANITTLTGTTFGTTATTQLRGASGQITTLTVTSSNITTLTSSSATLTNLTSTSGTITTLVSTSATLTTIAGTSANITTITENASPVVVQTDIGSGPNEVPLNQYLGAVAYLNDVAPAMDVGLGISTGSSTVCATTAGRTGTFYGAQILVDLRGLNSGGTAGDIIGVNGTALPCYISLLPAMTTLGGRMTCLETPAGGDTDIDLYSATEGTGVEDQAITALTETQIINAGSQTISTVTYFAANPAANNYLYLVGQGTANATYTAGRFLIEIFGT